MRVVSKRSVLKKLLSFFCFINIVEFSFNCVKLYLWSSSDLNPLDKILMPFFLISSLIAMYGCIRNHPKCIEFYMLVIFLNIILVSMELAPMLLYSLQLTKVDDILKDKYLKEDSPEERFATCTRLFHYILNKLALWCIMQFYLMTFIKPNNRHVISSIINAPPSPSVINLRTNSNNSKTVDDLPSYSEAVHHIQPATHHV